MQKIKPRRATRDAKIKIRHYEIDKQMDESVISDLEKVVANMLFRLWLKQKNIRENDHRKTA